MAEFEEFQASLLKQIGDTLGVPYEMLVEDYRRYSVSAEITERWRQYFRKEALLREELRRYLQPFFDGIWWGVVWQTMVPIIVGYDPQKLLPRRQHGSR